jgi:Myb/SANT-like DNA-binding domain
MELSLDKDNIETIGNNNTTTIGNKRTVWSDSETSLLLSLLKEESIAKQLNGHRNREGWRTIQSRLKEKGCDRTIEQIKNRHRSIRRSHKLMTVKRQISLQSSDTQLLLPVRRDQ